MPSTKNKSLKSKKEKKLSKLIENSESDDDNDKHDLSFYMNDRVKLMKEILKIIKPKKIKSMAPDCIKHLDIEEINSMLLEELLGISNKRLKYIFNGQNLDEDSSSTDPEEEEKLPETIDIITLDDVSDDDFVIDVDAPEKSKKHKRHHKIKEEPKDNKKAKKTNEQNLMSVLELLELQARARAIRSQLALEANNKNQKKSNDEVKKADSDPDDAVIIEIPKNDEIVISSSDSESESTEKPTDENVETNIQTNSECNENGGKSKKKRKITLNRDRFSQQKSSDNEGNVEMTTEANKEAEPCTSKENESTENIEENNIIEIDEQPENVEPDSNVNNISTDSDKNAEKSHFDNDEIVINVDQAELDGIMDI